MSISRMRHVNFIYEICPINFILTNLYWIAFHEIEIESYYMNEKNLRIFSICSKSNIFVNRKVLQLDILSYFKCKEYSLSSNYDFIITVYKFIHSMPN